MFRTVPLSIISSFSQYTQQLYMSYSLRTGSGQSVLILLASCMTYTIAVCTVKNCWWWTEELSETCRVSFQNKFEKLVHLVGFIIGIYHDARSPERQNLFQNLSTKFIFHYNLPAIPALHMHTDIQFWSHLAQFFLEWEMFMTKVVQKIKTHILCSITFCRNRTVYEIMWKKIYFRAGQGTDCNMAHA